MAAVRKAVAGSPKLTQTARRLLGRLRQGVAGRRQEDGSVRLAGERGALGPELAAMLEEEGLARVEARGFRLTDEGVAWLARAEAGRAGPGSNSAGKNPFRVQHGALEETAEGSLCDCAESPLGWLRRRRGADGRPLIDDAAFAAGERLRADFTRGQMSPRMGVDWSGTPGGQRFGQGLEFSEQALAARQRLRAALDAVGPELSGVLLDVCCFLKGLEDVERDRRWPVRSAKIILGLGLARLARHYGFASEARGREGAGPLRTWAAE